MQRHSSFLVHWSAAECILPHRRKTHIYAIYYTRTSPYLRNFRRCQKYIIHSSSDSIRSMLLWIQYKIFLFKVENAYISPLLRVSQIVEWMNEWTNELMRVEHVVLSACVRIWIFTIARLYCFEGRPRSHEIVNLMYFFCISRQVCKSAIRQQLALFVQNCLLFDSIAWLYIMWCVCECVMKSM